MQNLAFPELISQCTGGSDRSHGARVADLRRGSPSEKCDLLSPGDRIVAVSGRLTANLTHKTIVSILKKAKKIVQLDIQYEYPKICEFFLK